jgi:Xaa-Pro dipeptidase
MNRRAFLASMGAGLVDGLAKGSRAQSTAVPDAIKNLRPMTDGVRPITADERRTRIEKALRLMRANKISAMYLEGGSSLLYFTGTRSGPGPQPQAWLLPARGEPLWIAPEPATIAQALKDRGVSTGNIGLEEQVLFATFDGIRKHAPAVNCVNAVTVTAGCRMIKSPAEIALLQHANDVTIAAYRAGLATLYEGMPQGELSANIQAAYRALGYAGAIGVSFGKYTAYPHGSITPQKLHAGDVVQIDDGVKVEGYQADITRTTVFGKYTQRQLQIWNLERKAQDAALDAAKPGATCEAVDAAARKVITDFGFGPDYKVPGLPHRTGHGIGLDGHEWTYLVRGNKTRLQPGMCFSDEPMIAIYGEFGIRLEDCFYITEDGARTFSKQSPAIDQPFG